MHITNVKITKLHSNNGLKTEAGFGVLFFAGGKQSDKMNYIYTPPPSEHLSWIIKNFKFQMREEYFSDSFPVTCWNPIPLSFTTVLVSYPSSCHRLMLQQYRRNDSLILTLTLSRAHPGQERVFDLRWGGFIQWKWSWSENSNKCWKHWSYGQFWMQYMVITGICSFYFKSKYNEIVMNMNEKNLNMNFIIMRYIYRFMIQCSACKKKKKKIVNKKCTCLNKKNHFFYIQIFQISWHKTNSYVLFS